jgi:phosphatidylethanolamine-binding protein (PEBP) family uncharacterized protein
MRCSPQSPLFAAALVLASMQDASAFTAGFSWSGIKPCGRVSPAFIIIDAPKDTQTLRFLMTDRDAPNFQHGGGAAAYDGGGTVPQGAINYIGPCPPPGSVHRYVWTIEALDKGGRVIGRATAEGRFPMR